MEKKSRKELLEERDIILRDLKAFLKEYDNYPFGAKSDPMAPFNLEDPSPEKQSISGPFSYKAGGGHESEFLIMEDGSGKLFAFYVIGLEADQISQIAIDHVGVYSDAQRDEDGIVNRSYDTEGYTSGADLDPQAVVSWINENLDSLSIGYGQQAFEEGVDIAEIDEPLRQEIKEVSPNLIF